ncbi:hypothetical protein RGL59_004738 [Vibrio parahaemolyticus]|uniref:hypothetical protein n=1 Tax=Vibrio TaxID=662 RepID=UPI0001564A5D|nr:MULTISPECIES: hypothetical protein [Vibrio]EFO48293.1 hypothetical protein VIPARAQ4037_2216 [Vibrio parahaemolyticus AQ4037]EDM61314.1 hypothetical protein A79_0866 [Vibrio parahaemolyticus AQ3810]EGQ7821037.1 hypothetical protein [Vibrio parahaemolyticus]EGQ8902804.1 hypothetical protein [Vibrio parahaemolyticus]EGQ9353721.1 hypothetical protein [Vibrio parahaemolyticus]
MAIGIKVSGKGNNISENRIKSDDIGIEIEGENNIARANQIDVTSNKIKEICSQLNLPENLPEDMLLEAIEILKQADDVPNAPQLLEQSRLKSWLQTSGFNMAFWVSTAISLAGISISL